MHSTFIHAVADDRISFFMWLCNITYIHMQTHHILFITMAKAWRTPKCLHCFNICKVYLFATLASPRSILSQLKDLNFPSNSTTYSHSSMLYTTIIYNYIIFTMLTYIILMLSILYSMHSLISLSNLLLVVLLSLFSHSSMSTCCIVVFIFSSCPILLKSLTYLKMMPSNHATHIFSLS